MRNSLAVALGVTLWSVVGTAGVGALEGNSTLVGSRESMNRQNQVARQHDFTFIRTGRQIREMVDAGQLIPVFGNADYRLANVSYPAVRPVLKTFVERLGAQYRVACGEQLVVTSLTRPLSEQPRNASDLSVHPAGMAVDLRVPSNGVCRSWLEQTLLSMERSSLLDVTKERRPAHYHIAVFPDAYGPYAEAQLAEEAIAAAAAAEAEAAAATGTLVAAAAAALQPAAPARAAVTPGPGPLTTLLYAVVVTSGLFALMLIMRGEAAPSTIAPNMTSVAATVAKGDARSRR